MQFKKGFLLWVLFLSAIFGVVQGRCSNEPRCKEGKSGGLLSADCLNLDFEMFPQCLRSSVEVIELSRNRLRELTKEELQRYTSLKILYLTDNYLGDLEDSVFDALNSLKVLDLTKNGIYKLSSKIFKLPSLETLILSQNRRMNLSEVVRQALPIVSPLKFFDISLNNLEKLPELGTMPYLLQYNISGNSLLSFRPRDVAGMCNLERLMNVNFVSGFENSCDCWNVQRWLQKRNVKFDSYECPVPETDCHYHISLEDITLFEDCKSHYRADQVKATVLNIVVPVVVCVVVLLLIAIYCFCKRRKKQNVDEKDNMGMRRRSTKSEKELDDERYS